MSALKTAIDKLQRETGYGDQERNVSLTDAEIKALIAAATAIDQIAKAINR